MTLAEGDTVRVLVPADRFMAVQKERDDLRRAVALVNAWRVREGVVDPTLHRILAGVGEDVATGRAVLEIVRQVRDGSLGAGSVPTAG